MQSDGKPWWCLSLPKSFHFVWVCLLAASWISTTAQGADAEELLSLKSPAAELQADPLYGAILHSLREDFGLSPLNKSVVEAAPGVVLTELSGSIQLERRLHLYFVPAERQYFLLELNADPLAPEARLWSQGPTELVFTPTSILVEHAEGSERLRPRISESVLFLDGLGGASAKGTTPTDPIACLIRALGFEISNANLYDLLTSTACTATSAMSLALTGYTCLAALTLDPIAIIGCTVSLARIISCGVLSCADGVPTTCAESIQLGNQRHRQWITSCPSVHRADRYARYFTLRLTTRTRVRIDLASTTVDTYLYLLAGDRPNGLILEADDDGGPGTASRIVRWLDPGAYTLEATTYSRDRTGLFNIKVVQD